MTTHVCTAVELLTREIREGGADGKIERRGRGEGSERRRRRWRWVAEEMCEGRSECVIEEERCGDVVDR